MRIRVTPVVVALLLLCLAGAQVATAQFFNPAFGPKSHPAVGSWFGKAIQVCGTLPQPSEACPGVALYMTPTLTPDGIFLGADSLTLGGPPFGPHTTAHGIWTATGRTTIVADYAFMLNAPAGAPPGSVLTLRFRWDARAIDSNTMVGYVNAWFVPPLRTDDWVRLGPDDYPTVPPEGVNAAKAPPQFYKDPLACGQAPPACPLVFKFTIKRIIDTQ